MAGQPRCLDALAAGGLAPEFNATAQLNTDLFKDLMAGEHCLRGSTHRAIRAQLTKARWLRSCVDDPSQTSTKEGRCFRRLHARGLAAKTLRTHCGRVTSCGHHAMGMWRHLGENHFRNDYATAAVA